MSDAMNQHKKMAMGGNCYASGGSVKKAGGSVPIPAGVPGTTSKPPMNFGPPKNAPKAPPKTGFSNSPITKVKRVNGIKGV